MSLWAFRLLLFYIVILFTQPQNRFPFLMSFHLADLCVIGSLALHAASASSEGRPLLRFGPATVLGLFLMGFSFLSLYAGACQTSSSWNPYIDILMKNSLIMILIEAMATNVKRVWAVMGTVMISTLWWVKAGLRLGATGATFSGGRIMGPAVSMVENPNGYAYLMTLTLPLYLYFYQTAESKWVKGFFLGVTLAGVYIVFNTGSRTGLLCLVGCGAFALPKYAAKHKTTLISAAMIIAVIFGTTDPQNVERFRTIGTSIRTFLSDTDELEKHVSEMNQDEQSAHERKMKNVHTWALIMEYPIFGVGISANQRLYASKFPYATGQVHCEVLMAGRQMGIPGMGIYIGLIGGLFVIGQLSFRSAKHWWPEVADMGWTLRTQAIIILIGGAFSPIPWNPYNMILVGCGSAFYAALPKKGP